MSKEEIRRELQSNAFHELLNHNRVICNWGTGVGKSRVAINFVDYLDLIEDKHDVLILVGETEHKINWANEFQVTLGKEFLGWSNVGSVTQKFVLGRNTHVVAT